MFTDESTLAAVVSEWLQDRWPDPDAYVIPEQRVGRRIADFVVARVDGEAASRRSNAGLDRALTPHEIFVMRQLRSDCGTSEAAITRRTGLDGDQLRRICRQLVLDGFAETTHSRSVRPNPDFVVPVRRVVTIEVKLSDWRSALHQARAHSVCSHASWVLFDSMHEGRFSRVQHHYRRDGIGLLGADGDSHEIDVRLRPRQRRVGSRVEVLRTAELVWERLVRGPATRSPQTNLPGVPAPIEDLEARPTRSQPSRTLAHL